MTEDEWQRPGMTGCVLRVGVTGEMSGKTDGVQRLDEEENKNGCEMLRICN